MNNLPVNSLLHWNGSYWAVLSPTETSVNSASPLTGSGTVADPLTVVNGTSTNDILQWDGNAWQTVALPAGGSTTFLSSPTSNPQLTFTVNQQSLPLVGPTITLAAPLSSGYLHFYAYQQSFTQIPSGQGYFLQARFTRNGSNYPGTLVWWISRVGNPWANPASISQPIVFRAPISAPLAAADVIGVTFRINLNSNGFTGVSPPVTINFNNSTLEVVGV